MPSKTAFKSPGPSSTVRGIPVDATGWPTREARGVLVDLDEGSVALQADNFTDTSSPTWTISNMRAPSIPLAITAGPVIFRMVPCGDGPSGDPRRVVDVAVITAEKFKVQGPKCKESAGRESETHHAFRGVGCALRTKMATRLINQGSHP